MSGDREERVRKRAYEMWESEGRPHGRHDDHWSAADAEVGAEATSSPDDATSPGEAAKPARKPRAKAAVPDAKPRVSKPAVLVAAPKRKPRGAGKPTG